MVKKIFNRFKRSQYVSDDAGVSIMEMAILFPILMAMLMAVFDLGNGIVVNQKTVAASQIIADLITRNEVVDSALIDDVVNAGELALDPYPRTNFGYDIASVIFDEDEEPEVLWRVSDNISQSSVAIDATTGLGAEGEGVVVVTVINDYEPLFSGFVVDVYNMRERAFLRGRKSATVECSDCP
jgi:Flp pilus assembly protein TadG